jgi:hypothetical protein
MVSTDDNSIRVLGQNKTASSRKLEKTTSTVRDDAMGGDGGRHEILFW